MKDHRGDSEQRVDDRPETVIRPPSFSPLSLAGDLRRLAYYRDLLWTLTAHRIRVRYKQSLLGLGWAVLQPLSMLLIFTFFFSTIARMPSEGAPYAVFAYAALLPWIYFSSAVASATGSLVGHAQLITRVYFPREILPVTYILAALFDFFVGALLLVLLLIIYGIPPKATSLYVVPILGVLTVFIAGLSLLLSAVQVRFRDIGVAMPLLLQLWLFASPVFYPLSAVPEGLRGLFALNPMAGVVENFRRVVLQGVGPDYYSLGTAALIAVLLLPLAYAYFKHAEATVADLI